MLRLIFKMLLLLLAALTIAGCGGGVAPSPASPAPPPPAATGTLRGLVVAGDSALPLADARVATRGVETRTAADGSFVLGNVPIGARAIVRVSAPNYAGDIAVADVAEGRISHIVSRMSPVAASLTFDAAAPNELNVPDSTAQLVLRANSLVNASTGAIAGGQLTARLAPVDPSLDSGNMPGDFATSNPDGTAAPLESYGALSVELSDSAGNRLNLAPGSTADIRIPLATRSANPPPAVPLYYLDETTGRWVEDGMATLQSSDTGSYYAASVSHFSIFNADFRGSFILYSSCLQDANGAPVATAPVNSDGLDYSGTATAITDTAGKFSVPVRKGGRANVFSISGSRASNGIAVGPSEVDFESSTCLQLSEPEAGAPPKLTRQPVDATVLIGDRAEFDVFVQSATPARYQWLRNGQAIPGATGSYYSIARSAPDDDRAQFSVVISNDSGSITSRTATLTVSATLQPLITAQPQSVIAIAGETARFSVSATGGQLQYQWHRDGADVGATTNSYTTPATTLADDGAQFSVTVSNASGSAESAAATLTVQAAPTAPTISMQPQNVTVTVGATARFSVVASGTSLRFQWQRDGVAIAGATEASYATPPVSAADNDARFRVVVSNDGGSASSADAILSVDTGGASHQMRVVRLIASTLEFGAFGSMIDHLADANNALRVPSSLCSSGSATESLNTVRVVGGEQLPLPIGTLAATFSGCRLVPGLTYDGAISLQYAFAAADRLSGSVEASASNLRRSRMAPLAFEDGNDITVHGGYAYAFLNQSTGSAVTRLTTINPAAGATVTDNSSSLTANFTTGGMSIQVTGSLDVNGVFVPRTTRYSYTSLTWNVDSAAYAANGAFENSDNEGGGGSGEVTIRSGEVVVGRIYANDQGVFLEAGGEVEPL